MNKPLTCLQAYQTMWLFLEHLYLQTNDDDLNMIITNGELYSIPISHDQTPETIDPAIWDDWIEAVQKILPDTNVAWHTPLSLQQSYDCMQQYLVVFCNIGALPTPETLKNIFELKQPAAIESWLHKKWLQTSERIASDSQALPATNTSLTSLHSSLNISEAISFLNFWFHKNHLSATSLFIKETGQSLTQYANHQISVIELWFVMLQELKKEYIHTPDTNAKELLTMYQLTPDNTYVHFLGALHWLHDLEEYQASEKAKDVLSD